MTSPIRTWLFPLVVWLSRGQEVRLFSKVLRRVLSWTRCRRHSGRSRAQVLCSELWRHTKTTNFINLIYFLITKHNFSISRHVLHRTYRRIKTIATAPPIPTTAKTTMTIPATAPPSRDSSTAYQGCVWSMRVGEERVGQIFPLYLFTS